MTDELLKALAAELAPIIRAAVGEAEARAAREVADVKAAVAALSDTVDALSSLEAGNGVTAEDVRPLLAEMVATAVKALPAPEAGKPGVGLAGAMIDRNGALVVTLSDGVMVPLGPVVGKSLEARDVEAMVAEKVAALPKPKDGQDGFGLEDFSAELLEDGRTIRLRFARGEMVKSFDLRVPAMIYRQVHREGMRCEPGDVVTWAGSAWHCEEETDERPGEGSKAWRLMVKKGRDASQPAKLG